MKKIISRVLLESESRSLHNGSKVKIDEVTYYYSRGNGPQ
jgi:hypothetical protein